MRSRRNGWDNMLRSRAFLVALCCATCGLAQGLRVGFRYDREHVLFYVGKMRDPEQFSMEDLEKLQTKQPVAEYGGGGYLLPLTTERLRTLSPVTSPGYEEEAAVDVPALGERLTVWLGGEAKLQATAEQYVEQWGMENPIVRVGILARVSLRDAAGFERVHPSAFLIGAEREVALPSTTSVGPCAGCQKTVLNWFPGLGELLLEQWEAGWSVRLYRSTADGWRGTKVLYDYRD